jgi:hypothetical protein
MVMLIMRSTPLARTGTVDHACKAYRIGQQPYADAKYQCLSYCCECQQHGVHICSTASAALSHCTNAYLHRRTLRLSG